MSATEIESNIDPIAKTFHTNFKQLDACYHDGTKGEEAQWPKVLAVIDRDMPTSEAGYQQLVDAGTKGMQPDGKRVMLNAYIVNVVNSGYSRVPISAQGNKYVVERDAKPLSVMNKDEELGDGFGELECFPWTIVPGEPKSKDERKEEPENTWKLRAGMCIRATVWRDQLPGGPQAGGKADMFPKGTDVIPAFSLVVITLAIKGWSNLVEGETITLMNGKQKVVAANDVCPVKKGYGISPTSFRVANGSLYSYLNRLPVCMKATYGEILERQRSFVDMYPAIAQCIQTTQLPFFVSDTARDAGFGVDEDNGLVKVTDWSLGEENAVDIRFDDAMKFTNCPTIRSAVCMMELACRMGCFSMVVFQVCFV